MTSASDMVWLSVEEGATPVLVVGAGGIGCELLKNLILSGKNFNINYLEHVLFTN